MLVKDNRVYHCVLYYTFSATRKIIIFILYSCILLCSCGLAKSHLLYFSSRRLNFSICSRMPRFCSLFIQNFWLILRISWKSVKTNVFSRWSCLRSAFRILLTGRCGDGEWIFRKMTEKIYFDVVHLRSFSVFFDNILTIYFLPIVVNHRAVSVFRRQMMAISMYRADRRYTVSREDLLW